MNTNNIFLYYSVYSLIWSKDKLKSHNFQDSGFFFLYMKFLFYVQPHQGQMKNISEGIARGRSYCKMSDVNF